MKSSEQQKQRHGRSVTYWIVSHAWKRLLALINGILTKFNPTSILSGSCSARNEFKFQHRPTTNIKFFLALVLTLNRLTKYLGSKTINKKKDR